MTPEEQPMDPALERAISEIRGAAISDEVIEAAAARVWERLSESAPLPRQIRNCTDFQSLLPDLRAGRLPEARALLVRDHLRECVACRQVYEGRAAVLPAPAAARLGVPARRWAMAAGIVVAGGLVLWYGITVSAPSAGHAVVRAVHGTLYAISAAGPRAISAGEDLPEGFDVRSAPGSDATIALRDGSQVEMRERSEVSASQSGDETTLHLGRGSIIVQAAHRRSGHFYVATSDCRVAVTGTLFSVSAGVKGSRVSVVEGEVRLLQDNQEKILHRGDQASTSDSLAPVSLQDDLAWSRNPALQRELAALGKSLRELPLQQVRYSSGLVGMLPASTAFFASIPNLAEYFGEAQALFRERAAENPELRAWLAGPGAGIQPVLEKLRAANEYLGEEIVIFGTPDTRGPVFLAEVKREGFPEFLRKQGLPLTVVSHGNAVLFTPARQAPPLDSGFQKTPFYAQIAAAYREGAGMLVCADLARLGPRREPPGIRYLIAEQKGVGNQMETRAALAFEGAPAGMAAWLAPPSPMGALDYISTGATFVAAFATNRPASILRELPASWTAPAPEARKDLAASLGGEFAVALDGPAFPVPSWRLVAEVYDPSRFESSLRQLVDTYNRDAAARGLKPLRTGDETVDGRTYYMVAGGDPNPLTEAHYTFADGYLIAAPTRALVVRSLEAHTNGTGITHAPGFTALLPRDRYANYSAVVYQNLGTTLAPLAGLLGSLGQADPGRQKALATMGNLKPWLLAAYRQPDRITIASKGDMLGMSLNNFLSGGVLSIARNGLPLGQLLGTSRPGTSSR
ncbi:MAG TPA: FecR domain-containing protein [Bryobacteraceae bacterium]|nr:FecR domain-containing protein [Bryobacteraceae bacterium]